MLLDEISKGKELSEQEEKALSRSFIVLAELSRIKVVQGWGNHAQNLDWETLRVMSHSVPRGLDSMKVGG